MKRKTWRAALTCAIVGLVVEFFIVHEKLFFIWYEPHIYPMSWGWTRLEALAMTPIFMLGYWWCTLPLVCLGIFAFSRLRKKGRIPNKSMQATPKGAPDG